MTTKPKTLRIKPRPGVILAGLPAAGADVDAELAQEWIDGHLAVRVKEPDPTPAAPKTPKAASPAKET